MAETMLFHIIVDNFHRTFTIDGPDGPNPNVAEALLEMRRVLKRNGQLQFVEQGLAREPSVRRWPSLSPRGHPECGDDQTCGGDRWRRSDRSNAGG
jgi:hypothetical protein